MKAVGRKNLWFQERVAAAGIPYKSAAENVAYNNYSDPAMAAVEGWSASEGHRRNIEGHFDLTGIGVFQNEQGYYYFTQLFLLSGGKK
ncbi:MAG TPA: CAP domain-containing protein [Capillibacterium sp.]